MFEATPETIREQGVPSVVQAGEGEDIIIQMASSLINGATLEITYKITATNNSSRDTIIEYRNEGGLVAIALYEETPESLVYYEGDSNLRTYKNDETPNKTQLVKYDKSKTVVEQVTTSPVMVADFVPNNLTFAKTSHTGTSINSDWEVVTDTNDTFAGYYYKQSDGDRSKNDPKVDDMDSSEVYETNQIIKASATNPLIKTKLRSGESSTSEIVLSKVISQRAT